MLDSLRGLRVLLVEDEGLVMMLMEEYMRELGCTVIATAARLNDALAKAELATIDAAVLDVNLAGELSYPVAKLLHDRGVPFVFATGYGKLAVPAELGSVPVVSKPFYMEQLADALVLARAT